MNANFEIHSEVRGAERIMLAERAPAIEKSMHSNATFCDSAIDFSIEYVTYIRLVSTRPFVIFMPRDNTPSISDEYSEDVLGVKANRLDREKRKILISKKPAATDP